MALLDIAKAFPSVPRTMITDIICKAGAPQPMVRMVTEIYHHTPTTLHLHGRGVPIHPKRGMKEGYPLSSTLFLLYYDVLLHETLTQHPTTQEYRFVDNITVRAPNKMELLNTLNHLHCVTYRMGLHFNAGKTKTYHWGRNYEPEIITWQNQHLTVRPPILTYLGHVLAHLCTRNRPGTWLPTSYGMTWRPTKHSP